MGEEKIAQTMSVEEAQAEIESVRGNPSHPYWDKLHPSHTRAVQRMAALYEKIYPPENDQTDDSLAKLLERAGDID